MISNRPMSNSDERTEHMRQIRDDVLNFKESPLYEDRVKNRYYPVIGQGSHRAAIMLIGEAPGKNEALTSKPFSGSAGKILDELLGSVGILRENIYITNILKDRPPMNRDPLPNEISAYAPFLDRQIDIIQPKVIATLGRFSMGYIMEKFGLLEELRPISVIHGKIFAARAPYGDITIIPLYHPAAAIYNPNTKEVQLNDIKALKQYA